MSRCRIGVFGVLRRACLSDRQVWCFTPDPLLLRITFLELSASITALCWVSMTARQPVRFRENLDVRRPFDSIYPQRNSMQSWCTLVATPHSS